MYLLDTNHSSHLIAGHPSIVEKLSVLDEVPVATCAIVRGELFFMVHKSEKKLENLQRVREFFEEIEVFPIDDQVADIYGELKASIIDCFGPKEKAKRRRAKIEELGFSENDLWIAAVAKRYGYTVVSCDSDFRRLQEIGSLKVESWLPESSVP